MTATKTKAATSTLALSTATIGHNSDGAADTGKVWSDNLTETALRKVADLVGAGVRNKHETNAALLTVLGANPSDAAIKAVRMVFCVAHILANAKIDAPDMTPKGRSKWAGLAYSDAAARKADPAMTKAYNAAKAAWSLRLADIGIGQAEGTKAKNAKASAKRGTPNGRQDTKGAAPETALTRADYVMHVMGQANALLVYTKKHAGIAPGTIADLVHKLASACVAAQPEAKF